VSADSRLQQSLLQVERSVSGHACAVARHGAEELVHPNVGSRFTFGA